MTPLQDRRDRSGIPLRELARRLGVSHAFVCNVEQGKRPIPERLTAAWAAELGVTKRALHELSPPSLLRLDGLTGPQRARMASMVEDLRAGRTA